MLFVINYDQYKAGKEYEVKSTQVPFLRGIGVAKLIDEKNTSGESGGDVSISNAKLHKHSNADRLEAPKVGRKSGNKKA